MRTSTAGSPGSCARTGLGDPRTRSSRARSPLGQTRCAGRRVAWRHEYRPVGVPPGLHRRHAAPLGAEHRLELRRRLGGGHALLGRDLPCPAAREGLARGSRPDRPLAPFGPRRRRRSAVERQAGRRLGPGDPVSREEAEARFLRLRRLDRRGAESAPKGDLRRPGVQRSVKRRLGRVETKALTRTPVRSSMANTCSVGSS